MQRLFKFALALVVFTGAVLVSDLEVIEDAHAEGTSIWATGSESEVSELESELESAGSDDSDG